MTSPTVVTTSVPPGPALKAGVRTSEFWLAIVSQVAALLVLCGLGDFSQPLREVVLAGAQLHGGLYAIARGLAKKGALENVAPAGGEV